VSDAILLGGDTDTIASMTGPISGAYLGLDHIPQRWLRRVREEEYNVERVVRLAEALSKRRKG
jgi:ADP-ribosylglycohydrolase